MQLSRALTSLTLAASLFTDPSIASKYFGLPPGPYVFAVLGLVLGQIIFLLGRRKFQVDKKIVYLGGAFVVYATVSLFYRVFASQGIGDLSLHVVMVANFYFLLLLLTDEDWQNTFVMAISIAGVAHFATLIPDPLGMRERLIAATAYELGAGGLGDLSRRETGLFPAPAMLVAFVSVLFVTAFLKFVRGHGGVAPVFFILLSLVLGLSTFNRSFLIGMVFALLVLSWCTGARAKIVFVYAIGASALFVLPLGEYFEFVSNRFGLFLTEGIDASQRWTGDTGIITGIDIFLNHPFFGSPIAPRGGTLEAVSDQMQVVNPHNGWVQILAIYGIVGGAPVLFFYVTAMRRTWRVLANRRAYWAELSRSRDLVHSQMLFAAISASLVPYLMIEPLGEYSFIYLMSIAPIITSLPRFFRRSKIRMGAFSVKPGQRVLGSYNQRPHS